MTFMRCRRKSNTQIERQRKRENIPQIKIMQTWGIGSKVENRGTLQG